MNAPKIAVVALVIFCTGLLFMLPASAQSQWQDSILSGKPFKVVFDKTSDKFDDTGYTNNDPMGTLKGGETYEVVYSNGAFSCTGYHESTSTIGTWTYNNGNPMNNQISLWGRLYTFNDIGEVIDPQYGLVGHLEITNQWKNLILSGEPFKVVFDKTSDKFDDTGYTNNDPMGTLKGGETYEVVYSNGAFSCTGYHESTSTIGTWTYNNGNLMNNQISLWGRLYTFNEIGEVIDPQYGLVGHLEP